MKREILFRGKRIDNGKWELGFLSWNDSPRKRSYHINNDVVYSETVGQFTGLTDKNGTKIFEGDIVKTKIERMEFTTTVVWGEKSKGWSIKCDRTGREKWGKIKYYSLPFSHNIDVIGNVHDNSELLK